MFTKQHMNNHKLNLNVCIFMMVNFRQPTCELTPACFWFHTRMPEQKGVSIRVAIPPPIIMMVHKASTAASLLSQTEHQKDRVARCCCPLPSPNHVTIHCADVIAMPFLLSRIPKQGRHVATNGTAHSPTCSCQANHQTHNQRHPVCDAATYETLMGRCLAAA